MIGAVHVDQGNYGAQQAALRIISPLTQSLLHLLTSDDSTCHLAGILHPKQNLYEMTGGIVSVRTYKEEAFLQMGFPSLLWNFGNRSNGVGYVGVVRCKEIVIAALVEASRDAATNVACELAAHILNENPSIITRLQSLVRSISEE